MSWWKFWKDDQPKVVDDVFDKDSGLLAKAGGFIDRLSFTDEEKSDVQTALINNANKFVQDTLGENTERSKARRKIALMWIKLEAFLVIVTAAVAPWDMELAKFYWSVVTSELMFWTTLTIMGFFFGNHLLRTSRKDDLAYKEKPKGD